MTEVDADDFLDTFRDSFTSTVEIEGQEIGVNDNDRVIYSSDCDLVERLSSEGGEFGPSDGEAGYATICP